jgi:hypothetical protein
VPLIVFTIIMEDGRLNGVAWNILVPQGLQINAIFGRENLTSCLNDRFPANYGSNIHITAVAMLHCLRGNVDAQLQVYKWLTGASYWKIRKLHTPRYVNGNENFIQIL